MQLCRRAGNIIKTIKNNIIPCCLLDISNTLIVILIVWPSKYNFTAHVALPRPHCRPYSIRPCAPSPPLPCSSASTRCPGTQHLRGPVQHLVQIPQLAATSEANHGVKTVFHLPLTCFLRTLQRYYCLTVLTLSHLAASQITPSNTALSCVMNKSLFHHGLSCTFSLNSQSHHTFPIQISPKNSFVPSSYKLKIIIKALGYTFLWVSQWPWLTALKENVLHTKKMSPPAILRNKSDKKNSFVQFQLLSSSVPPIVAVSSSMCCHFLVHRRLEERGSRGTGV